MRFVFAAVVAAFGIFQASLPTVSFTGFLDTYAGATWYASCAYKSTNAYSGNCGTFSRATGGTQTIGFLANGKVDAATFSTFCSGTICFLDSWVDQVNGINTTDGSAAGFKPRAIVNSNGNIAVCPQPGSKVTTAFNSAVNTQKQHVFVVAKAGQPDSNWNQAGLPTTVITANVASGNPGITSMSSQSGISLANGGSQYASKPGVVDSAGFLPNSPSAGTLYQTYLSALPTGTTGTLAFSNGTQTPTGTQSGDTLTVTNAVLGGVWIMNGPASSAYESSAYWGVGLGTDLVPSDWTNVLNASSQNFQNVIGIGMRGLWNVYDFDTFTANLNFNGVNFGVAASAPTGNITYSTNVGMTLFANPNGSQNASNNCFETYALFSATQASRVAQAQLLMAQDAISFPFASTTSDGFTMTGYYQPNNSQSGTTAYGASAVGADVYGLTWNLQSGGYTWPSIARATNINNSTTMWRFITHQGDSDENLTNAERAEINVQTGSNVTPGHSFSFAYQFNFEAMPNQAGTFAFTGQIHYDGGNGTGQAPDITALNFLGGVGQFVTQKTVGAAAQTTNCGSSFTITPGTNYAVVGTGFWSNGGTDTLTINAGPNGSTLPQVCNTSGVLYDQAPVVASAYFKAGIYRGFPWDNAGTVIERVMNMQWNATTANAYSAQITTQLALPTHP